MQNELVNKWLAAGVVPLQKRLSAPELFVMFNQWAAANSRPHGLDVMLFRRQLAIHVENGRLLKIRGKQGILYLDTGKSMQTNSRVGRKVEGLPKQDPMQPYVGLTWVYEGQNEVEAVMAVIPARTEEQAIRRMHEYQRQFYYQADAEGEEVDNTPEWPHKAVCGKEMEAILFTHFDEHSMGDDLDNYTRFVLDDLDHVTRFIEAHTAVTPLKELLGDYPWLKQYASDLLISKLSK